MVTLFVTIRIHQQIRLMTLVFTRIALLASAYINGLNLLTSVS